MLLVQKYLKSRSLEELEVEHGVKARIYNHKFSLNYNQIESADNDLLAQQCRGLILTPVQGPVVSDRPIGNTKILARPFDRFFNLGQGAAAAVAIEHSETRFYEKMDGTLINLYFDFVLNEWHVATRSVPEANFPIDGFDTFTFRTLFEKACKNTTKFTYKAFVSQLDPCVTYIFELTTPLNRIVVEYKDYSITLLGARDNESGIELDPIYLSKRIGVPHAQIYHFSSLSEMVTFVSSRPPQNHEGVVVCDQKYRRIKVKNAGYLALNRIRDNVTNSPRGIIELILLEKLDDALSLFPEHIVKEAEKLQIGFRDLYHSYHTLYVECLNEANKNVTNHNICSDAFKREHRKNFVLAAQRRKGWLTPMMEQYQGKSQSFIDWIQNKRNQNGSWSNSFLDSILHQLKNYY